MARLSTKNRETIFIKWPKKYRSKAPRYESVYLDCGRAQRLHLPCSRSSRPISVMQFSPGSQANLQTPAQLPLPPHQVAVMPPIGKADGRSALEMRPTDERPSESPI